MPLRQYKCKICNFINKTFKKDPQHCGQSMEVDLVAPNAKMMEPTHKAKGKSVLKNQEKILRARSRNNTRDRDIEDLIPETDINKVKQSKWLGSDGRIRKKIDDL